MRWRLRWLRHRAKSCGRQKINVEAVASTAVAQGGILGQTEMASMRRQMMIDMELLHEQLLRELDRGDADEALPRVQRSKFQMVAKAREHGLLAERLDARSRLEEAQRGHNKGELNAVLLDWISNERKVDRLFKAMQWQQGAGSGMGTAAIGKLKKCAKAVKRKPQRVLEMLAEVETSHPWAKPLADVLMTLEANLDLG